MDGGLFSFSRERVAVVVVEVPLEVKADGGSSSNFSLLSIFGTNALTPSVDLCPTDLNNEPAEPLI